MTCGWTLTTARFRSVCILTLRLKSIGAVRMTLEKIWKIRSNSSRGAELLNLPISSCKCDQRIETPLSQSGFYSMPVAQHFVKSMFALSQSEWTASCIWGPCFQDFRRFFDFLGLHCAWMSTHCEMFGWVVTCSLHLQPFVDFPSTVITVISFPVFLQDHLISNQCQRHYYNAQLISLIWNCQDSWHWKDKLWFPLQQRRTYMLRNKTGPV